MSEMFSMRDVTVCYDNVEAVRNVSLSVAEGQIVTVIGPTRGTNTDAFSSTPSSKFFNVEKFAHTAPSRISSARTTSRA